VIDWTVVLTTGIGALAGFGGTYLGYRGTIRTLEAENTRLREQRAEEHFRHRQGYYHRTLILVDRLHKAITGVLGMDAGEFLPWLQQFQAEIAGTTLFGREAVQKASERMYESVLEVESKLTDTATYPVPDLRETHADVIRRYESRRNGLLTVMQEDVTPS
jgi:hypothetical protein